MPEPTTLRALAGLPATPASLADSTLVMIDCQNTYTRGVMALDGVDAALDEAAKLLERARAAGIPIIHIEHDDGDGSLYDIRAEIGQIVDRVAPQGDETVIVKNFPNSFVQTELDDRLKAVSARNLILAGFMTHMCVNSTARGAFNLGYAPTVVAGATATRALPGPAGVVSSEALQAASLAAISDLFGIVVPDGAAIPDELAATINFVNSSKAEASIYWLSYTGVRELYETLPVGQRTAQSSYVGNRWVVLESGARTGMTVAKAGTHTFVID